MSKQFDYLNRLTAISSSPSGYGLSAIGYSFNYNPANQRTQSTFSDGSHWVYGYDSLGQVTNGARFWATTRRWPGRNFSMRSTPSATGPKPTPAGTRTGRICAWPFTRTTRSTKSRAAMCRGRMTWWGGHCGQHGHGQRRYGGGPQGGVLPRHGGGEQCASPLWLNVAVSGAGNNVSGHQYVAQEPEHFQYDADGNLTNDGRYAYFWDAENRLVAMTNNTSVGPVYNLTFAYDAKVGGFRRRWSATTC